MFIALLTVLLTERGLELVLAQQNRRWALARGAKESGKSHYGLIVAMHGLFYISLTVEHLYFSRGWNPLWPFWLSVLILMQGLRGWSIASLGRQWNTRILVIPGSKRVASGPYRFIRHPNYLVVAVEILGVAVLCDAYLTALLFSLLNALILRIRIAEEELALRQLDGEHLDGLPRFVPRIMHSKRHGN